jgi:hypothetical protein
MYGRGTVHPAKNTYLRLSEWLLTPACLERLLLRAATLACYLHHCLLPLLLFLQLLLLPLLLFIAAVLPAAAATASIAAAAAALRDPSTVYGRFFYEEARFLHVRSAPRSGPRPHHNSTCTPHPPHPPTQPHQTYWPSCAPLPPALLPYVVFAVQSSALQTTLFSLWGA